MVIVGLELELETAGRVEWLVADVSLARAFFGGVPAARLLARTRLASDERDLSASPLGDAPSRSTWDVLVRRLLGKTATLERVKRQVARHTRAASDEGPLPASDGVVAALAYAVAASEDMDASLAEILAGARAESSAAPRVSIDPAVLRGCGAYDARLTHVAADTRGPFFEACVRLATHAGSGPMPFARVLEANGSLVASELALALVRPSNVALYPRDFEPDIAVTDRRMALLERAELDVLMTRDPRELAAIVARVEVEKRGLDSLLADLGKLLANSGDLLLAMPLATPLEDDEVTSPATPGVGSPPSSSLPSWLPTDWASAETGGSLAEAFERGTMTLPRLRAAVARGGEPALDALGAEMLNAAEHPFASAAFAELLARSGRARDVIRLVTYFAVAPDPSLAARALAMCVAPELPTVLRSWLEAMLPTDGGPAPQGEDPQTSSAARLTACVASLAPYPHLYRAVRPLLARVSEAPPAPSS